MKSGKANSATNPHRGRPTKGSQQQAIKHDGAPVAREFQLRPLRGPVDASFGPYYRRVLAGDLAAIPDYIDASVVARAELDASFYELVGRLVPLRCYRGVRAVLSAVEEWSSNWPGKRESYDYWYRKLKPPCDSARKFICEAYRSRPDERRGSVWNAYVFQPLSVARFVGLIGQPNEDALQKDWNRQQQEANRRAKQELLEWAKSAQGHSFLGQVQYFATYRLVPKQVFDDLAQSRISSGRRIFSLTPAQVSRRYACKIARLSESSVSHRSVGKRKE